jgi:hypothetical protein
MQPKTWHGHIFDDLRRIEPGENIAQLAYMFHQQAARIVILVQTLQAPCGVSTGSFRSRNA